MARSSDGRSTNGSSTNRLSGPSSSNARRPANERILKDPRIGRELKNLTCERARFLGKRSRLEKRDRRFARFGFHAERADRREIGERTKGIERIAEAAFDRVACHAF